MSNVIETSFIKEKQTTTILTRNKRIDRKIKKKRRKFESKKIILSVIIKFC